MEQKRFIVYKHENLINHKVYIGQTCQQLKDRWQGGGGYRKNKDFYDDIQTYGWKNFSHEILAENLTQIEANQIEAQYIEKYDSIKNGYNVLARSGGNLVQSYWDNPDTKAKIVKKLKQQRNTPEYKKQQSERMKANWEKESYREAQKESWTQERREAISQSSQKAWEDQKYHNKISSCQAEYKKEQWQDDKYRKKLTQSLQDSWDNKDKREQRLKRCQQARHSHIVCVQTGQSFETAGAAAKYAGVSQNAISNALYSKSHASGWHPELHIRLHWKRVSDADREEVNTTCEHQEEKSRSKMS